MVRAIVTTHAELGVSLQQLPLGGNGTHHQRSEQRKKLNAISWCQFLYLFVKFAPSGTVTSIFVKYF